MDKKTKRKKERKNYFICEENEGKENKEYFFCVCMKIYEMKENNIIYNERFKCGL